MPSTRLVMRGCSAWTARALVDAGYLADRAVGSLVRFSFWMLGGAGLALAEAPEADQPRLREEWRYLIHQTISGLRAG